MGNDKKTIKERTAMEMRYLGSTAEEIAERIDIPKSTIDGWFSTDGKLYSDYVLFEQRMNERREEWIIIIAKNVKKRLMNLK